ncbi:MAG: 3-dehydroquinate synthase [Actinomycetota bacterium]|nr:3-dehydroquinate synthase [Actinomycetota bacterium]
MERASVTVRLKRGPSRIFIGRGILGQAGKLAGGNKGKKAFVITDSNIEPLYLDELLDGLGSCGISTSVKIIKPGEQSKDLSVAEEILSLMIGENLSRDDMVVALGGGVVGDLSGFVASIYKRGISLLAVPTTLIAQVDSSIGGKTAVNLKEGKNMVGTFHQPLCVICDVKTILTLPEREFRSGIAEVVKYYFLSKSFPDLRGIGKELLSRKEDALLDIVHASASLKARVVSKDEFDRKGLRVFLNYGHTLGHALEAACGYGDEYTHGEAISIGMVFAAMLSEEHRIAQKGLVDEHRDMISPFGLPVNPHEPFPSFEELLSFMERDKKNKDEIDMVLLRKRARPLLSNGIEAEKLKLAYERLLM